MTENSPGASPFRKVASHSYKPISPGPGQTRFDHKACHFPLYQITQLHVKKNLMKIHITTNLQIPATADSKVTHRRHSTLLEPQPLLKQYPLKAIPAIKPKQAHLPPPISRIMREKHIDSAEGYSQKG
jgi:hypothetical protein